jgi:hypothetical protein
VTDGAGIDQLRDYGCAERPGAAGNDDMTIAKVHSSVPRHHSPILQSRQGRAPDFDILIERSSSG